jgi:hypothetical protein
MISPGKVFTGRGCPECAEYGFQSSKSAILYYLLVFNPFGKPLYKIGITNRTIQERFRKQIRKIEILEIEHFARGKAAYDKEQRLLKQYRKYRYDGPPVLIDGNEEIFTVDILSLEKNEEYRPYQLNLFSGLNLIQQYEN